MVIRNEARIILGDDISASIEQSIVKLKGPKGEICKKLLNPRIFIGFENGQIVIRFVEKRFIKADKMFMNTYVAHIKNMIDGVRNGYVYKLKICSGHFPMNVTIEKGFVLIKNFLGEKVPRKAKIIEGVAVNIDEELITVSGINLEDVAQTAARIEQATRITKRDKRIFQDGCYIIEKAGKALI
ncbi:MAG TPA: 50S ribosomal protein L6 [Candidatus Nanoarchaeia archaeon]|nr:50S ribosomal protein L6 [Candidatus Nanoarchaeia archaeon]